VGLFVEIRGLLFSTAANSGAHFDSAQQGSTASKCRDDQLHSKDRACIYEAGWRFS
jgi:hypothetical protein